MLTPPAPRPPKSGWDHPLLARYLDQAPPAGPVAAGGGMAPATLVGAYRQGAFPWPTDDPEAAEELRAALTVAIARGIIPRIPSPAGSDPLDDLPDPPWWCPDPRTVLAPGGMRIRRSLVIRMRNSTWTSTMNECFVDVVRHCRREGPHQWITDELIEGYAELHALGWAHSIEIWDDDRLVGGMYGVLVGRVFTGESMFHRASDGSKIALADFLDRFGAAGGVLLDAQLTTSHLMSLGAREVPRAQFLATVRAVRDDEVRLECGRLPVSRLAPPRKPPPPRPRREGPPAGRSPAGRSPAG